MQQFVVSSDPSHIAFYVFSKLRTCAILIFKVRMIPKLKNNHLSLFAMLKLVQKDPSFVLLAHQAPEILHFMFLKMAKAAILEIAL